MAKERSTREPAVVLHADVVGSAVLVHRDEALARERIQDAFGRFCGIIQDYGGTVHELREDALLATFARASDAVSASLSFQAGNAEHNAALADEIRPELRIGIATGEAVTADGALTGPDVPLAQRIEQLAAPGGVCIQGTVYETIPRRLDLDYTALGERQLEGFDQPVRVWAVSAREGAAIPGPEPRQGARPSALRTALAASGVTLAAAAALVWVLQPWESALERADPAKMAFALPDRPSVAVLPFENLSKNTDEAYFSDGVTEDIITDLSKISGLFVFARDSTLPYKEQPVPVRQVAEELGARYVLDGSVRRTEESIRITAQLMDAVKGNHVWAERYDREVEDVFTVQSDVARQVAKALAVTLKASEHERLFQKYTANIDAYDVFLQARRTVDAPSKPDNERGEKLFSRVIELDPEFAGGYAGLAYNYSVKVRFQYSDSPKEDVGRSFELARKAVEVDPSYAWGHIALGGAYLARGDPDGAVEAGREALALEPNGFEANLFMGFYLQFAGETARAVEHLELAKRLSPAGTVRNLGFLIMAYFMDGDYASAVDAYEEWTRKFPHTTVTSVIVTAAAAYAALGREAEAAAVVERLLETHPGFDLSRWRFIDLWKVEADRTRLYEAARKAGVPVLAEESRTASR